jgi:signal transduction histidine kinase
LRGFLRTVRADTAEDEGPQPRLDDVERLAATMGDSGLRVSVRREGEGEVPLGVQVSAYRIVQEALTNTLRHARASAAEILVRIDGSEVLVRVRDDGSSPITRPGGHGLIGMRERAEILGGSFAAGPRPGGGFEVEAHFPVREKP